MADCCAVFLVDSQRSAIGLVHSGKKGTELNVVGAAMQKMAVEFGTVPADLVAQLGPCIRPPFYEVDFAADIVQSLKRSGVRQIFDSGENTAADLERYYSYRMEKGQTGRMLALLGIGKTRIGGRAYRRCRRRLFFSGYEFTGSDTEIRRCDHRNDGSTSARICGVAG